jgi:hypothetical protein
MTMRLLRDVCPPEARTRCAVHLLMYFYRHPRVYVTIDALSMWVGYAAADVEAGIETLVTAGVIVQHRRASLAAVMCRLVDPGLSPGVASSTPTNRWRRQTLLIATARERCRRAAMRATQSDERLARTSALMATIASQPHFARDG